MISKLKILEMGDIHLGHRTTSTDHIVNNLNVLFSDVGMLAELDLIIIAGDLFDRLLPTPHPSVSLAHRWIHRLFSLCARYDIVLRVLEGTPSHDNKQPLIMCDILETSDLKVDFKYIDKLDVEYIERFDATFLYIPDEWNPDCMQTLSEARDKIRECGLTQVDFAVMHGQFDVQVPQHLRERIPCHDSKSYLELVKYLIFIGHVHTASLHDRIIAAGSFDRLRQGEEEEKGCVRVDVCDSGVFDYSFVVNHGAKQYLTFDYQGVTTADTLLDLRERLSKLPDDSYVRLKINSDDPISKSINELKSEYPFINFNIVTEKVVKKENVSRVFDKPQLVGLRIEAIPNLIRERVMSKHDENTTQDVLKILGNLIGEIPNDD